MNWRNMLKPVTYAGALAAALGTLPSIGSGASLEIGTNNTPQGGSNTDTDFISPNIGTNGFNATCTLIRNPSDSSRGRATTNVTSVMFSSPRSFEHWIVLTCNDDPSQWIAGPHVISSSITGDSTVNCPSAFMPGSASAHWGYADPL